MKTLQHRILWWMVDAGAPGHVLLHGWQVEAAKQLNIHRITLYRQIELMLDFKILFEGEKKGEVIVNTAIFNPASDTRRIKKERIVR
jgi:hypothetical protein